MASKFCDGVIPVGKLVVLKIGEGSFERGFPITLQIGEENAQPTIEMIGRLPPNPDVIQSYVQWQAVYRSLDLSSRPIGLPKQITRVYTFEDCRDAANQLCDRFNLWLQADSFRPLRERWLEKLKPSDTIRVILQTNDFQLQRLPWHLWELMERYPNAEIALSAPVYEQIARPTGSKSVIRILAILGDSRGIDTQADRATLEQLAEAEVYFLVEPSCKEVTDQLWQQPWDMLFFAGHSASQSSGETGRIYLNPTESLTISQLKYGLKKAVARGLQLAIFNSCDGLGLAREFVDLQIPQLIVMREPVPDRVAQEFLKDFLTAFARGESIYLAVREAREQLQWLENQFPCATWLPILCQNPAERSLTWHSLLGQPTNQGEPDRVVQVQPEIPSSMEALRSPPHPVVANRYRFYLVSLVALGITALLLGVRYWGVLQPVELRAFDQLLRLRPDEKPDSRLLVITVTEEDVQAQHQELRRGSLSDQSLAKLLEKLESYQPSVIGLDIYRDYQVGRNDPLLAKRMRQSDRFFTICEVSSPKTKLDGVAPPPEVDPNRLGFSNFVVDPDQIVRRHLLALTPPPSSPCPAFLGFSTQLALRYLSDKGIALEFMPNGAWKLGQTQFKPLEAHTGGYQGIDAWGHQILLNYHAYHAIDDFVPHTTLGQVLKGQISADAVKDHIVLIGTTAESFHDYSLAPYARNQENAQMMSGVVLQAQMVSQIVSAVLDGRPLFWALPVWAEILWLWGWAVIGSLLSDWVQRLSYLGLVSGLAIATLYGICLLGLIGWGCWLPLVPAALAFLSSAAITAASIALTARQQPLTSSPPKEL